MTTLRGGTTIPSGTRAPAATIDSSPTTAPFRTIAPMPTRQSGSMVQPCRVTEWPTVTSSARVVGCCAVTWRTQLSWTFVRAPIRIRLTSPRTTVFIQTLASSPSSTAPITWADESTKARGPSVGRIPL